MCIQTSATQLPAISKQNLCWDNCYSQKTGGITLLYSPSSTLEHCCSGPNPNLTSRSLVLIINKKRFITTYGTVCTICNRCGAHTVEQQTVELWNCTTGVQWQSVYVSVIAILEGKRTMWGKYYMRTLEQADAQAQFDLDRIEGHLRPSILNHNTPNLPHLATFSIARSICGTYD